MEEVWFAEGYKQIIQDFDLISSRPSPPPRSLVLLDPMVQDDGEMNTVALSHALLEITLPTDILKHTSEPKMSLYKLVQPPS